MNVKKKPKCLMNAWIKKLWYDYDLSLKKWKMPTFDTLWMKLKDININWNKPDTVKIL